MQQITYGDKTSTQQPTGHIKDMHCGGATLSYNKNLRGWAIPGVYGTTPGMVGRIVRESRAREIVQQFAKLYEPR